MRRSCRRFAAAAYHPADRRAEFLVLAVDAAKPAAGSSLPRQKLGAQPLDVLTPRFGPLGPEHPTDPLIAGKRGEVFPCRQNFWVGNQDTSQISRHRMCHSVGDDLGAHRSPIVASMRSNAALRSARRRALASSAVSCATTPPRFQTGASRSCPLRPQLQAPAEPSIAGKRVQFRRRQSRIHRFRRQCRRNTSEHPWRARTRHRTDEFGCSRTSNRA